MLTLHPTHEQTRTQAEWLGLIGRAALGAAWAAQSPGIRERFLPPAAPSQLQQTWLQTADGWELPLWRRPPRPGADGAPVLLAVGPELRSGALDLAPTHSLVSALHRAGYDVYLLSHRGDPDARAPSDAQSFDFDDLVAQDTAAALAAIRSRTQTERVLFVGHGIGGLLFVAHLARFGGSTLAGGVTLCAPVVFDQSASRAREVHQIARLLPAQLEIPHRVIQRLLLAGGRDHTLHRFAQQVDGPSLRRLALDHSADLSAGLVQQIAKWHSAGHLCDRGDHFDDVEGLRGLSFPLLSITADADPSCPETAVEPLTAALQGSAAHHLSGGWAHLDPILSPAASREVFPRIIDWLAPLRRRCWDRDR